MRFRPPKFFSPAAQARLCTIENAPAQYGRDLKDRLFSKPNTKREPTVWTRNRRQAERPRVRIKLTRTNDKIKRNRHESETAEAKDREQTTPIPMPMQVALANIDRWVPARGFKYSRYPKLCIFYDDRRPDAYKVCPVEGLWIPIFAKRNNVRPITYRWIMH